MALTKEQANHIIVVDDDESVREALSSLFRSVGYAVSTYSSAAVLPENEMPECPTCLVLDVRMPGLSGLDFQDRLAEAGIEVPIIFITGHGDIPMTVRAMKAGAVEFLTKPFRDQDLLDAVGAALEKDGRRRADAGNTAGLLELYAGLTPREAQILPLVTKGLMNKQIAGELGIREITVKVHRGNIMRKMKVRTLPDLVRIADQLNLKVPE